MRAERLCGAPRRPYGYAGGVRMTKASRAYRIRIVLFLAIFGAASALTGFAVPRQAAAQTVGTGATTTTGQEVVVRGNRRIETSTILSYLMLEQGQVVTAEQLNAAVRRMFDTGLFADVDVTPTENQLIVTVVENPAINVIAFEGNDVLEDEELRQIISLRPRLPFTRSSAEADAQAIIEVYRRTGRYGAEVEPVIIERSDNRVDLVFEIREGEVTGVSSIDFVGNESFSDRKLRGVIETNESGILASIFGGDVYDPDRLELDKELLRRFYLSRGHADFAVLSATAELAPDRDGFYISFTVDEGPVYTFGELDVEVTARGLDPEEFLALIPDDLTGDTYDASEVEDIIDDMTDLAGQKGFAFVQVRPRADKDSENLVIDITFELIEGNRIFVERIDIVGNTRTLDRVIRREFDLVEGDIFNARKVREARDRIRALDYFETVEVETAEGTADDRAVLTVKVQEKSTGSLSFGLGFSTSDGPVGQVAVTERNFLGRGQILRAQIIAAGDTQVYDFTFTEPRFLDRDLSVGLRAFFIDEDRSDTSSFDTRRLGIQPTVGFPLGEDTDISVFYSFQRDEIIPNSGVTVSDIIRRDEGVNFVSMVGYDLVFDRRNDPVEPTAGYRLELGQDFAGLGGDSRYIRTTGSAKGWTSFFDEELVVSLELEAGGIFSIGQDTRVTERYFLGGDSFRGFASEGIGPRDLATDDALGGNYFVMTRLEASFPLGLPDELGVYGGVFVDAGTLWGLDGNLVGGDSVTGIAGGPIDNGMNFRLSAGALLFLDTPFGPLELSFGAPLIKETGDETEVFRLTVGTRF